MAAQYIRKAQLMLGVNDDLLDVSALHFRFTTQAHTLQTPKTLQLRIYNPSIATVKKVLDEGTEIYLSAGYEGSYGVIFQGEIVQLRSGRENGTDTYLDISATDGDSLYNQSFTAVSVPAGTNATARLNAIARNAEFEINSLNVTDGSGNLPRGRVFFGLSRDHLRTVCATIGASWSITNGKVDIVAQNAYKAGDIPVINSLTGMVGVPVQTLEGISVKCLLNPGIEQGIKVQLDNASIQQYQADLSYAGGVANGWIPPIDANGLYKVLYCTHSGDTRGQEWYTDFVGIAGDHLTNTATQGVYAVQDLF